MNKIKANEIYTYMAKVLTIMQFKISLSHSELKKKKEPQS